MKEVYYFQHDYNARNDPKLQDVFSEHGVMGIGVFWCIVEQLYEQDGFLPLKSCKSIAFALHVESNVVESIVQDFGLFQNDGEKFWSNSVNARISKRNDITEKRKQAAVNSWTSRREKQMQSKCNAQPMVCNAIKENKIKEKDNIKESIKEKNEPTKRFRPPTLEEVQSYIQEKGYSIDAEAFIAFYESKGWMVGKNKMKDWRMAVVTWSKRDNIRPARKASVTKKCNDEWI